jgi:hypothetical protein
MRFLMRLAAFVYVKQRIHENNAGDACALMIHLFLARNAISKGKLLQLY